MNANMKEEFLRAYNACDSNKTLFLSILKDRTGLTKRGIKDHQEYIDTLVFKER
jgi:hypothetical protein